MPLTGVPDNATVLNQNITPPLAIEVDNSEENGEEGEYKNHQILTDVILRKIFEQTRVRELLTCRSVCKKWNILIIPFTRLKCNIQIFGNQNTIAEITHSFDFSSRRHYPDGTSRTIKNFVKIFNLNELGIPFSRFRLGSFCTTDAAGQQFLNLCGDIVKKIHFFDETFYIEDVSEILSSTPKLEVFQIPHKINARSSNVVNLFPHNGPKPKLSALKILHICQDHSVIRNQYCPTFLEELLTCAQNISSLFLWDRLPGHIQHSSSLEVLRVIEKLGRESKIQNLYISHVMSEHMEILRRMAKKPNGLKLKKLEYRTNPVIERNIDPIQLVQLFKHTLQHLNIKDKITSFSEFPIFPHLKDLSILVLADFNVNLAASYDKFLNESGAKMELTNLIRLYPVPATPIQKLVMGAARLLSLTVDLIIRTVKLHKIFPVLQRLSLRPNLYEIIGQSDHDDLLADSEQSSIMKSFIIEHIYMKLNGFRQILKVFPALTELSLNVNDDGVEILREIWSQMRRLKKLCIYGSIPTTTETMDSLLSGIPIQTIQEFPDMLKDLDKMTAELRNETILRLRNQHSKLPSITNLTSLRHLDIFLSVEGVDGEERMMTDLSGYLALYPMNHFHQIYAHKSEFTESCLHILKSEMELDSYYFGKF